MKAIALAVRSPICHSCFRRSFLLISLSFLLVCFAPCQMALAVSPAPDGGYAGNNTAEGTSTLFSLSSEADNTAIGFQALFHNTSGTYNSGEGFRALFSNTTGVLNTATGGQALSSNTIGAHNTATGENARSSTTIGSNNIYIADTGFAGDNNVIAIGAISASGTAYAKCFIGGIFGTTVTGSAVQVGSDGQLGVATSSKRFKDDIKPMDRASESILALQPVTFRYKKEMEAGSAPQFGLVAEEVAEVNPDLVIYRDGQPYTVRYDQVNAMLLNEFLKEHRKVEQLQLTLAQQQKEMRTVLTRLKKQESQIQKVSAQLEVSKPGPETVASNK